MLSTRGMTQRSHEELRWHYQDAPTAVGEHAASLEPAIGGTPDFDPTPSQRKAADDDGRVRAALATLTHRQQALLEACYTPPPGLDMGHGAGDGAVRLALEASTELAELQRRLDVAKIEKWQRYQKKMTRVNKAKRRGARVKAEVIEARRELNSGCRRHRERLAAAGLQLARDTMGEVKVAHRDYISARREMREADRQLVEQAPTIEQQRKALDRAEPTPRREPQFQESADAALAMAEALRDIGEHPLDVVRATVGGCRGS